MIANPVTLSRPRLHAAATIYLAIVLNLPAFFSLHSTSFEQTLSGFALVCSLTYLILALVSLAGIAVLKLFLTFAIPLSALVAYFTTVFGVVIDYGMVSAIFGSEATLGKELVSVKALAWFGLLGVLPVALLWRSRSMHRADQGATQRRRHLAYLASGPLAALAAWGAFVAQDHLTTAYETRHMLNVAVPGVVILQNFVPLNWIGAAGMYGFDHWIAAREATTLLDPARVFHYSLPARTDDTLLVFVLGEAARFDHMSLFGYPNDTTPLLKKESDLVAFRGHSCDTITKAALACMFVRPGGYVTDPVRGTPLIREKNVFWVLRSLGFAVEIFSTQGEVGFYLSTGSAHYKYRETYASGLRSLVAPLYDDVLLPDLADSLARHPRGRRVEILHLMGSHYSYASRYPREFDRFRPSCPEGVRWCPDDQQRNAYDNSVLYTDSVLAMVIEQLRKRKALLIYTSDHGESLGDPDGGGFFLHGTPKDRAPIAQRRVPFVVWASEAWLADSPNRAAFERMRQREALTFGHQTLFDSILDCLGVASPDGGVDKANSWCG